MLKNVFITILFGLLVVSCVFNLHFYQEKQKPVIYEGKTINEWSTLYDKCSAEKFIREVDDLDLNRCIIKAEEPFENLKLAAKSEKIPDEVIKLFIEKVESDREFCLKRFK